MAWDWSIDGWIVLVGVLSAGSCALLGNYLVLRRMSLMGDAISHAVLPGLAIGFLLSHSRSAWPMFLGAVIVGALTALMTETIRRFGKVEHGAAMGVVFSVLFAVGLVLIRQAADHVDLDPGCVLYGNIAQVPLDAIGGTMPPVVRNLTVVFVLNVAFVVLFYKELKICAFDSALATAQGIPASAMHYALMIMVAVTTVANFEAVGSILVIAMLIVPAATAHLLTNRLGVMILLSVAVSMVAAVSGHVAAFMGPGWIGLGEGMAVNTAAMIAVMTGALFAGALLLAPEYGLLGRVHHRLSLARRILCDDILGLLYRWEELRPRHGEPMPCGELLAAVGGGWLSRWALRTLERANEIKRSPRSNSDDDMTLTKAGLAHAARLIRSHRLWESYVHRHFDLPLDHLHMPAERVEHFITPAMDERLREHLTDPPLDPHGRSIPLDSPREDDAG